MNIKNHTSGYIAVVLLVFVVVSVIMATAAVNVSIANLSAVSDYEQGTQAMAVAQSGAENGLLRLIRDPSYTGETLTVDQGTAEISVTGTNPQTMVVVGNLGTKKRTLRLSIDRTDGVVNVTSWQEVYN
jgi:hypothetical protein